jgi:hypothetical protein
MWVKESRYAKPSATLRHQVLHSLLQHGDVLGEPRDLGVAVCDSRVALDDGGVALRELASKPLDLCM